MLPELAIQTTTNFVICWLDAVAWTIFWVATGCDAVTNFTTVEPGLLDGVGDGCKACTGSLTNDSFKN